jgi:hypothetical protein
LFQSYWDKYNKCVIRDQFQIFCFWDWAAQCQLVSCMIFETGLRSQMYRLLNTESLKSSWNRYFSEKEVIRITFRRLLYLHSLFTTYEETMVDTFFSIYPAPQNILESLKDNMTSRNNVAIDNIDAPHWRVFNCTTSGIVTITYSTQSLRSNK